MNSNSSLRAFGWFLCIEVYRDCEELLGSFVSKKLKPTVLNLLVD